MGNLKAIRKRIQGVRGTQQLTRAMKLVSAAKLRKAQENAISLRAYTDAVMTGISHLAQRTEALSHPLLAVREEKKALVLVFTSDRGMCGSLNLNVCRATEQYVQQSKGVLDRVDLAVIGKKGNEYLKRREYQVFRFYKDLFADVTYDRISRIGNELSQEYVRGDFDSLHVIYTYFRSSVLQRVEHDRILPVETGAAPENTSHVEHIFEPGRQEILDRLFPLYVNTRLYQALLESVASEMGARMTAMDNATKNAEELIRKLTIAYNKARQEAITKELMDIVSGAEAIR